MRESRHESTWITTAREDGDFPASEQGIMHDWLRALTLRATTLVPLFFVRDVFL